MGDHLATRHLMKRRSPLEEEATISRLGSRRRLSGVGSSRLAPCAIQDKVMVRWAAGGVDRSAVMTDEDLISRLPKCECQAVQAGTSSKARSGCDWA
jgi:hypothetical protein